MGDLLTVDRARLNGRLAVLSEQALVELIGAVSAVVNGRYTIPSPVPSDVEEACIHLMLHLVDTAASGPYSERLGDWSISPSRASGIGATFPKIATAILMKYKTPAIGPQVVKEDA